MLVPAKWMVQLVVLSQGLVPVVFFFSGATGDGPESGPSGLDSGGPCEGLFSESGSGSGSTGGPAPFSLGQFTVWWFNKFT
ncbi:hypothetical protein DPMN_152046 [Dreissena polymorpha]|uniref:Secreted protein n=1 Tax=Dreissena polymorpha TaxID=45954 RepID=A0A9D4FHL2_DREPO|nr:hypothetical protein DPMN_152046 [Dreissena polymorpha]